MKKYFLFNCIAFMLIIPTAKLKAQWKQVNLGPVVVETKSVAVIGSDVFAGTYAGINRSTDNGVTWISVSSSQTFCFGSIGANIFAGTLAGVIVSTDSGNSWSAPNSGMPYYITALVVKDTIIFAGTDQNGIFRSTNYGISWSAVNNGLGNAEVNALAVSGTTIYAGTAAGLCLSTDNGNNWSTLATNNLSTLQFINCITINGSTIFVGTPGGVLRSIDNGNTWAADDTGLNFDTSIFSILVNNSNIFIGTTASVYLSTDNGSNWTAASSGLPVSPSQVYSIAVGSTKGGSNLYAATNNGVYLSSNYGTSWTAAINGMVSPIGYDIAGNGPNVFAVLNNKAINVSTDYGTTWKAAADSGLVTGGFIASLTAADEGLYAATASGVFLSSNNGENWSSLNGNVIDTVFPNSLVLSGSYLVVSTGNKGIFYSSNNGTSWNKASGSLPFTVNNLSAFGNNVFLENWNGIYLSTNNGEDWTKINDTLTNTGYSVGVISINSTLFAAGEPIMPGVITIPGYNHTLFLHGGLFSSTDNGKSWARVIGSGIPDTISISLLFAHDSDIFMVVYGGLIYYSTDNGNYWNNLNNGLPNNNAIQSFFVNDSNIFVGTDFSGIWRYPLSQLITGVTNGKSKIPQGFELKQNYPNPFNPSTIISWQLAVGNYVTLKVYDVLGREVKTLVNEYQAAGEHSVTFNAERLPSGVYFYRLTCLPDRQAAGSFIQTKKLMVIK